MDNAKDDAYYIGKILNDLKIIVKHTNGIEKRDLKIESILCDSILFRIIQISENTAKLSDNFKNRHSTIPWKAIKGMRNRIVHDYGDVDMEVIYVTVTRDIPIVLEELRKIA